MQCTVHSGHRAVGTCLACGSGVCTKCQVTIAGLTYCVHCLEAGRYQSSHISVGTPEESLSGSEGSPIPVSSFFFSLGAVGIMLLGISIHFTWLCNIVWLGMVTFFFIPVVSPINPIRTIALALLGIGVTLGGFAFHGYRMYYGSRLSHITGNASFIFAWWPLIADLLQYSGLVWLPQPSNGLGVSLSGGPLYPLWHVLEYAGLILFSITLILWAATMLWTRKITQQSPLSITVSIFFLSAAHVILLLLPFILYYMSLSPFFIYPFYSFYLGFLMYIITACLVEPGCIIFTILVRRSMTLKTSPSPMQS